MDEISFNFEWIEKCIRFVSENLAATVSDAHFDKYSHHLLRNRIVWMRWKSVHIRLQFIFECNWMWQSAGDNRHIRFQYKGYEKYWNGIWLIVWQPPNGRANREKLLSEHSKQYFSLSENYAKQMTKIYICHLHELNINWSLNSSTILSSFADFINIFCVIISIEFLIKLQFFQSEEKHFYSKSV